MNRIWEEMLNISSKCIRVILLVDGQKPVPKWKQQFSFINFYSEENCIEHFKWLMKSIVG